MAIDMVSYAIGAKNGGGGGGGGGDCNLFPVTITVDYDHPTDDKYPFTADKTFAEIAEAVDAGKTLLIREVNESSFDMYVTDHIYREPGTDWVKAYYTTFCIIDSSIPTGILGATLYEMTFNEDRGHYIAITFADITVEYTS